MLKSLEIQASIRSIRDEIKAGIDQNLDMTTKATELEALIASYDEAVAEENKKKKIQIQTKETKMSKKEFNKNLKALILGKPLAEGPEGPDVPATVTGSGNYMSDENGSAYLVPEEQLTELVVNEGIIDLAGLVTKVAVAAPSGKYPVIDESQEIELVDFVVDNETEITKKSAIFDQDTYELGLKGILVPLGRDLLQDASIDLVALVYKLLSKTKVHTVNREIVACGEEGTSATADMATVATIDKIKEVLIATLPISYQANAKILTNQNTFAKLANIKDETGNYMIQRDVTNPQRFAIDGHEIVVAENKDMKDDEIIIGDFRMIKIFERLGFEVMSDASAGFKTNSILVRAIARYCVKNTYADAFVCITKG